MLYTQQPKNMLIRIFAKPVFFLCSESSVRNGFYYARRAQNRNSATKGNARNRIPRNSEKNRASQKPFVT